MNHIGNQKENVRHPQSMHYEEFRAVRSGKDQKTNNLPSAHSNYSFNEVLYYSQRSSNTKRTAIIRLYSLYIKLSKAKSE